MFTRAKRRALLEMIRPLAEQARAERAAYEASFIKAREELMLKGLRGSDLRKAIRKTLASQSQS